MIPVNNSVSESNMSSKAIEYRVAVTSKTFKVLSDTMYKNKIRAITRELSCNCNDAHADAGVTRPFEITLPTQMNPSIVFRDFGFGISEEDIYNVFTVYFESTKTKSNNQIGELGLGAKSPYCYYTRSMQVKVYQNGICRTYSGIMTDEPKFELLSKEPSNLPRGMEITIPVLPEDIQTWRNEVAYCLRPFKGKAEVQDLEIQWFNESQIQSRRDIHGSSIYALYNNIVYPLKDTPGLSWEILGEHYPSPVIRFDIGLLDFMPSREELSLDPVTVKNIVDRVNSIEKKLIEDHVKDLYAIGNLRERRRKYNELEYFTQQAILSIMGDDISEEFSLTDELIHNLFGQTHCLSLTGKARSIIQRPSRRAKVREVPIQNILGLNTSRVVILLKDLESKSSLYKARRVMFGVEPSFFELHAPLANKIKEYMMDDDVVIYKVSEMCAKTPRIKAESRPATPNIYHCKNGNITPMKLSAKEVKELKGHWIPLFGENTTTIEGDDGPSKSDFMMTTKKLLNLEEFYFVRKPAFKWVAEMTYLYPLLLAAYKEECHNITENNISSVRSHGTRLAITDSVKPVAQAVGFKFSTISTIPISGFTSKEWLALRTINNEIVDSFRNVMAAFYNEMQKQYPLEYYYVMNCNYSKDQTATNICTNKFVSYAAHMAPTLLKC